MNERKFKYEKQLYGPPITEEKKSEFYVRKFKREISYCTKFY